MSSLILDYSDIISAFNSKVKAYEFYNMQKRQIEAYLCNWLHSSSADPYVRALFSNFSMDDDDEEVTFEMAYETDEYTDREFVIDILSDGIIISWLKPQVLSTENIKRTYGSTMLKFYSESNHLNAMTSLYHETVKERHQKIALRGYIWNSYIGDKR